MPRMKELADENGRLKKINFEGKRKAEIVQSTLQTMLIQPSCKREMLGLWTSCTADQRAAKPVLVQRH
jgi:hypothetical protein